MFTNDLSNKAVLITGGTKGIGLATGLAFGRQGARVYLTHKWGSADEDAIRLQFKEVGAAEPVILEADVTQKEDTTAVFEAIKKDHDQLEVLISNVAFGQVTKGLKSFKRRSFQRTLDYSTWPFVGYLQAAKAIMGKLPRYAIGMSSDGAATYYPGYAMVGAAKTVMEIFCRYLAVTFFEEDIRINILRARSVVTESLEATFGPEFVPFHRKYCGDDYFIKTEEVADAALALCSGLMDGVSGEILFLDRGFSFADNAMRMFEQREKLGL